MKFQDSSFNGLKVTVCTKSVTHPLTDAPKAICPINFGGIKTHKNVSLEFVYYRSSMHLYICNQRENFDCDHLTPHRYM